MSDMSRGTFARLLGLMIDDAQALPGVREDLRIIADDRDKWRELAQALGGRATVEYDASRQHFKMSYTLDAEMLHLTTSTKTLVRQVLTRMHDEAEHALRKVDLWR